MSLVSPMTLLWPRWEGIILTLNLFRNKSKKDAISKMLNLKWFDLTGRSSPTTSSEQKQVPAFEEHMLNDPNGGCGRLSIGLAACLGYGIRPQKWHITFAHHLETFLLSCFFLLERGVRYCCLYCHFGRSAGPSQTLCPKQTERTR